MAPCTTIGKNHEDVYFVKAVLSGRRRAAVSEEGIEEKGDFSGESATRIPPMMQTIPYTK